MYERFFFSIESEQCRIIISGYLLEILMAYTFFASV